MEKVVNVFKVIIGFLVSWLGILAVPVFLLVGCNLIDYITGLIAARYRNEAISSYKGIRGIVKKICLWLLVLIGAWIDVLIQYAVTTVGLDITFPFLVSTIVAIWLVVNEMISILENIVDIGVKLPPFLMPIVKLIKDKTEEVVDIDKEEDEEDDGANL